MTGFFKTAKGNIIERQFMCNNTGQYYINNEQQKPVAKRYFFVLFENKRTSWD
jgi:hypothetical protein